MMGCNGFALNVLNRYEGSLEDFHPHLQAITAERSRWKTLVDSSSGLPLAGFWPADHPLLIAVADWLSEGRLPVIIDETVRVAPFVRQSTDGRLR